MKRDHEGTIRKIADFLGEQPAPEQWKDIFEYTSFDWMKRHEDRFEVRTVCDVPPLKSGAMVRQGQTGKAKSDGMTDEISVHLRQSGNQIFPDQQAVDWYYEGGNLPA